MKIALIGYGKMGKEIEKVALSRGHEIVSIIDINNQDDFESEAFKSAIHWLHVLPLLPRRFCVPYFQGFLLPV